MSYPVHSFGGGGVFPCLQRCSRCILQLQQNNIRITHHLSRIDVPSQQSFVKVAFQFWANSNIKGWDLGMEKKKKKFNRSKWRKSIHINNHLLIFLIDYSDFFFYYLYMSNMLKICVLWEGLGAVVDPDAAF